MRIGLISDTHIPVARKELWPQVYAALRGVDLIMHGGDLMVPDVLDWLENVAPVMAVQGNGDYTGFERSLPPADPRLSELPETPPLSSVEGQMQYNFGGPVDVIVRGSTHRAEVTTVSGVLIVNPGSPTFPNHMNTRLGTVGFLDIDDAGRVQPTILQLE